MSEKFTPSPGRVVKIVNEQGKVIGERHLNRRERRRLGIGKRKVKKND
jgi:hypothetical protein